MNISKLQEKLTNFSQERDWEQFHNPKNLAIALSVECSELLEEFQWLTEKEANEAMSDPERANRIRDELADVTAYLIQIAGKLNIDLEAALMEKMSKNAEKYPLEKFKGIAQKYNR